MSTLVPAASPLATRLGDSCSLSANVTDHVLHNSSNAKQLLRAQMASGLWQQVVSNAQPCEYIRFLYGRMDADQTPYPLTA